MKRQVSNSEVQVKQILLNIFGFEAVHFLYEFYCFPILHNVLKYFLYTFAVSSLLMTNVIISVHTVMQIVREENV